MRSSPHHLWDRLIAFLKYSESYVYPIRTCHRSMPWFQVPVPSLPPPKAPEVGILALENKLN